MTIRSGKRLIMGFDFGTQKIGVATGQEITRTAQPLGLIKAQDGIPNWQALSELVDRYQPDLFVTGLPLNMDGTMGDIAFRARKFANRLNARFKKPSYTIDERLTSQEAATLTQSEPLDAVAAALIIETWLNHEAQ